MSSHRTSIAALLALAVVATAGSAALAQSKGEKKKDKAAKMAQIGDAAPPLKIAEWVQGDELKLADGKGKNIYVVEFWATWCPPCRESIPHLTELHKKFKDQNVVFIGISDEPTSKVKPFVEKQGKKMDYIVAVDDNRATSKAYMEAYGQNGIPAAFVVNKDGNIAWIGHPMGELEKTLDKLIAGKYDLAAFKSEFEVNTLIPKYFEAAVKGKNEEKLRKMGAEIMAGARNNPQIMNQFAWTLLTAPPLKHRDLDLALEAAKAAYDASEHKDPSIADTYARALYMKDKKEDAIAIQKKAIALCKENDELKEGLEKSLKQYESGKPIKIAGAGSDDDDDDDDKDDMKGGKDDK